MRAPRSLTGWVILGCSVGLYGCGGGAATPPGSGGNKAPGVAAVVGVDASMGDISNVPPASAPAGNPAGAHGASSDDAGASLAGTAEGANVEMPGRESGGPTGAHDGAAAGGTVADRAAAMPAAAADAGASLAGEAAIPYGNQPPGGAENAGAGGDGVNQGAGGQAPLTTQRDSIEYPIVTFFGMAKTGNYSQSEEVISAKAKAKNLAAMIRAGDISDEMVSEYQTTFANPQFVNRKPLGTGVQFTFNTATGETATFLIAKEGANFVIKEIELSSEGR